MKFLQTNSLIGVVLLCVALGVGATNDTDYGNELHQMMHDKHAKPTDDRTSLNLSPMMKQHQLRNMRAHLNAIQEIIGLLGQNRFEDASQIAHKKLGMTPEMETMCRSFDNAQFMTLGLGFHKSGDALGDALKTGELNASLSALNATLQHCVACHTKFKQ